MFFFPWSCSDFVGQNLSVMYLWKYKHRHRHWQLAAVSGLVEIEFLRYRFAVAACRFKCYVLGNVMMSQLHDFAEMQSCCGLLAELKVGQTTCMVQSGFQTIPLNTQTIYFLTMTFSIFLISTLCQLWEWYNIWIDTEEINENTYTHCTFCIQSFLLIRENTHLIIELLKFFMLHLFMNCSTV